MLVAGVPVAAATPHRVLDELAADGFDRDGVALALLA
eukprot:COSAG01_NODE_4134_length_5316_cov_6.930255_9_plen_37_part_00